MRIHWGFCAASVAVAALVVSSQLSQPSTAPLLRGVALLPDSHPAPSSESLLANPELVNDLQATAAGEESEDIARLIGPAKNNGSTIAKLNLKLPEMDLGAEKWKIAQPSRPDFFGKTTELSRTDVSGKIHFDDSEAAKVKPLEDTILGAEVELKIRL